MGVTHSVTLGVTLQCNIKGKEGIEGLLYGTQAETQWPLKGADGFVRARSSGKTGAPFSHLPTGGRAGARKAL